MVNNIEYLIQLYTNMLCAFRKISECMAIMYCTILIHLILKVSIETDKNIQNKIIIKNQYIFAQQKKTTRNFR